MVERAPPTPVLQQLHSGLERALEDRRRIDELVTNFEYGGVVAVPAEGQRFEGQGAVKRFLTTLLVDNEVRRVQLEADAIVVELSDPAGGAPRQLNLQPTSRGAVIAGQTLVSELMVHEAPRAAATAGWETKPAWETKQAWDAKPDAVKKQEWEASPAAAGLEAAAAVAAAPLFAAESAPGDEGGPKWETYDGRVRQRIWQQDDLFAAGNPFLKDTMQLTTGRLITIVDATVWNLYGEKMRAWAESMDLRLDAVVANANEDHKTLATFTYMLDELKRTDPLRRSEPVLAVGGGVLTDTAGFACACWRRGIPWCRMPTTLLGIVDASVGIKVAINYHRKNGVGHFFSPSHTFVDSSFLATVERADIRSGVGEIMKAALIHDARLYELMDTHGERLIEQRFQNSAEASRVIKLSIDAMLECIGPDLWEEALLRPMDFGHSFSRVRRWDSNSRGPLLLSHPRDFESHHQTLEADERFYLRHGEAVAIDCVMNALIAEQKGLLPVEQADSLLALYARLGLPCSIGGITAETYKRARDEIVVHRDGLLRAPLPAGIGECAYVDDMSDAEIEAAFARLEAFMAEHPETSWDISKSFASGYADEDKAAIKGA